MNQISPYTNGEFDLAIEPHDADGFRVQAPGLARALGFREAFDLLRSIPEEEKGSEMVRTPGGEQRVGYITEAGFYRALGQRQPARITDERVRAMVERFQAWVYREVLPSLRKTEAPSVRPELVTRADLARMVLEAEEQLAITAPKAEAFDAFLSTSGDYSVNEAAKILSRHHDILTGERRLRTWMESNGWIYRDSGKPRAYQVRLDQGRLAEKAQWHYHPETGEKVADAPQVRVTAKGVEALAKALTKVADQGELDVGGRVA